ncbi:MAG: type III pantothenate kinase [Spirochaetales bacterium]|nr:type III pantothenate kinase [Spirochaetales bacterium]
MLNNSNDAIVLAIDAGSSRLFGGILQKGKVLATFQKNSTNHLCADELGLYLMQWLDFQKVSPEEIEGYVYCSVVPELNPVLEECSRIYFKLEALSLRAGVKSGLQVKYTNHHELGADLIANAVAAVKRFPGENLLIADFGTATSLCAVSRKCEYLGGTLVPGLDISMEALAGRTARLPEVEIRQARRVCGRDTVSAIQGGLYFGTLGMLKELCYRMKKECFPDEELRIIATGSHAELFEKQKLFNNIIPELVLLGLDEIRNLNLD